MLLLPKHEPGEQGLGSSFQSIATFPFFFPLNLGAERTKKKYLSTEGGYLSQENVVCVEPSGL